MPEFSGKNSSPISWKGAALARFEKAIPEGSGQELITEELKKLKEELIRIKDFNDYDPRSLCHATKKTNYRTVKILRGHAEDITSIHALPNRTIISGGTDKTIQVWKETSPHEWQAQILTGHTAPVKCVQGLPGNKIISGGADGTIRIWTKKHSGEWQNEVLYRTIYSITCIHALPSGEVIAGDREGTIWLGNQEGNDNSAFNTVGLFELLDVTSIHALSGDCFFASYREGGALRWQKSQDGKWTYEELPGPKGGPILHLQALSNSKLIAGTSSFHGGLLRFYTRSRFGDWGVKEYLLGMEEEDSFQLLGGNRVVSGGKSNKITIWQRDSYGDWDSEILEGHQNEITSLQVLPSGMIISGSRDRTIRIWDGEEVT